MKPTIYQVGAPTSEVRRLENLEWPNEVSKSILEALHAGIPITSLLDAGAGPGTQMAELCYKLDIEYRAFDNGKMSTPVGDVYMADILKRNLWDKGLLGSSVVADVLTVGLDSFGDRNYDLRDNSLPDIVHMRFVLMHLPACEWAMAIMNMLMLAQKRLILMEYDWRTVKSSSHPTLIEESVKTFERFAKLVNLNLYAGRNLTNEANGFGYPVTECVYSRAEGHYAQELASKLPTGIETARKIGEIDLANELQNIMDTILGYGNGLTLVPAEIHAVVIDTSKERIRRV